MAPKSSLLEVLLPWHSLVFWVTLVLIFIVFVTRNKKCLSNIQTFLQNVVYNLKFFWVGSRLYLKYLPKGDDGLLMATFFELNKLQPTPFKVKNIFVPSLYVDKPADIQIILNNPNTLEKATIYSIGQRVIGRSLFGSELSIWKPHRRLISHSFQTKMLDGFFDAFNYRNHRAVKKLQKFADTNQAIDLWDHFSVLSFDLLCGTMMGIESDELFSDEEKREITNNIENFSRMNLNRAIRIWLHPDIIYKPLAWLKGYNQVDDELLESATKIANYKKKLMEEQESEKMDARRESVCSVSSDVEERGGLFLRNLLDAKKAGIAEIKDNDVTQEVLFMMIAGIETSGLTMCYTMLMLAKRPQIQDKVYQEIIDIMGKEDGRSITFEDVERMELLDRCIKETLRLFPVIPAYARNTTSDIQLSDNQIIEKGTTVVIAPFLVHRKPELYDNPLVWNPDNFLPEKVEKRPSYSFIPFSAGPRGCLGARYAQLSMKVTLAMSLKKYRVSINTEEMSDINFKFDFILRSINGYKIKLHTRK